MKTTEKIQRYVTKIPQGVCFTYSDLKLKPSEFQAGAKALERFVKSGQVVRERKGLYYKPEESPFGPLPLDEDQRLRPLLFREGQRVGYLTGIFLYHRLGLTMQVPNTVCIARNGARLSVGSTRVPRIKYVTSYAPITEGNIGYLEYLDVLKDFTKIPDGDPQRTWHWLVRTFLALPPSAYKDLIDCALHYPPRVAAGLGAMMENFERGRKRELNILKLRLNPLSQYGLGIPVTLLPTAPRWNLKTHDATRNT